ncbi:MAG: peptidase S8 [Candidatus Woesearchaeota archaeon]|nr:MAG: peptidase S8 [Candidatus Woesearchaeota archaeon]
MNLKTICKFILIGFLGQVFVYCPPKGGGNDLLFLALAGSQPTGSQQAGGGGSSCDLTPADPLYSDQWHIKNTGQSLGISGEDANVEPVWNELNWGQDIYVAVVDDGIDIQHEDLQLTYLNYHYDYVDSDNDLTNHYQYASHGTSVAGVIGARCNDKGVRGIAPLTNIIGYNLLKNLTSYNIADAMIRNKNIVQISNNSWGAPDGTGKLDDSLAVTTWKNAILDGIQNGNNGKGIIYLWAGGNGSSFTAEPPFPGISSNTLVVDLADNSNYDGQANYVPFVNAICAVTNTGKHALYSEKGANLLVCGHSNYFYNEGTLAITTTDIRGSYGYSSTDYNSTFGGTSSATPLVSGVVALMLKANPNLTWRDIRYILAKTARQINSTDSDWQTNGAGLKYNHKYGFGVVDAQAAVNMAKTHTSLGGYSSLLNYTSSYDDPSPDIPIPDNDSTGISRTMNVSTSITKIEGVLIEVKFSHQWFGDLEITLTSPSGTKAYLAKQHYCPVDNDNDGLMDADNCPNYTNKVWFFGATVFMDENPNGNWTLTVKDLDSLATGTLHQWRLQILGR